MAATKCVSILLMSLTVLVFLVHETRPSWATGPEQGTAEVRAVHGVWQLRCGRPPGAQKEKCALVQNVKAEDRANISLMIMVLRSYDGKNRLLRVFAPLGVLLPTGLGLKVDNVDIGHAPFTKCGPAACMAEVVLDDNLLTKLKNGTNAIFIIFQTPESGIGIPISLNGFQTGFAALP